MAIMTGEYVAYESVIIVAIAIVIDTIIHKIKTKAKRKKLYAKRTNRIYVRSNKYDNIYVYTNMY